MGTCFTQEEHIITDCEMCRYIEEMFEDLDKLTELPTISPILHKHKGYIDLKRARRMTINQIYRNELNKIYNTNI